jgi:hypothetical protein
VAVAFSIRRFRVSGFFALSMARMCSRLRPSGRALIGGAGDRIGAEGAGEVRGLEHDTGLGIKGDPAMQLGDAFLGRIELLGG